MRLHLCLARAADQMHSLAFAITADADVGRDRETAEPTAALDGAAGDIEGIGHPGEQRPSGEISRQFIPAVLTNFHNRATIASTHADRSNTTPGGPATRPG